MAGRSANITTDCLPLSKMDGNTGSCSDSVLLGFS